MQRNIAKIRNGLRLDGRVDKTGVTTVLEDSRGILLAYGDTVPTDAETGYAKGCIFIDTNASAGAVMLANEGDATSCDFNTSLVSGDISGVTAGLGLSGGGASGAVTLNYDGSHVVAYAGISPSETDSDASVVISVAGVLSTDIVLCTIVGQAGTAYIVKAVPTTDTITVTLSGNGGAGTKIAYQVLRAAA